MIPTYNQAHYIAECIESVLIQSYNNIEVLVSDDCSTDATVQPLLQKYASHKNIRIISNKKNVGRVKNYYNTLYREAKGEWVINLDGDDFFLNGTVISNLVTMALSDPDIVMVSGQSTVWDSEGKNKVSKSNCEKRIYSKSEDAYSAFLNGSFFPFHGTTLYKRTVAKQVGFYEKDIISSDLYSFLKLMGVGKVASLPLPLLLWRQHDENASKSFDIKALIDNAVVFSAALDMNTNLTRPSKDFLQSFCEDYAFKKGKDIAWRILKNCKKASLCIQYIKALSKYFPSVAVKIACYPKIALGILRYSFPTLRP